MKNECTLSQLAVIEIYIPKVVWVVQARRKAFEPSPNHMYFIVQHTHNTELFLQKKIGDDVKTYQKKVYIEKGRKLYELV